MVTGTQLVKQDKRQTRLSGIHVNVRTVKCHQSLLGYMVASHGMAMWGTAEQDCLKFNFSPSFSLKLVNSNLSNCYYISSPKTVLSLEHHLLVLL